MKILNIAVLSAALFAAGPAFADRGHDRGHDRRHWKEVRHVHKHHRPVRIVHRVRYAPPRQVVHHYRPAPVYYAPAAGIHVVLPSLFIPLH